MEQKEIDIRLTQNEKAISSMELKFDRHEQFVHQKFDQLEAQNRITEQNIIDKIGQVAGDLHSRITHNQESYQQSKQIDWKIVLSVVSIFWGVIIAIGSWAMTQQQGVAVSRAIQEINNQNVEKAVSLNQGDIYSLQEDIKSFWKTSDHYIFVDQTIEPLDKEIEASKEEILLLRDRMTKLESLKR